MEETIIKFISQVGVPAGIAIFVLVRLEAALKEVSASVNSNTRVMIAVLTKLDCDEELNKILGDDADVSKTVK
jgi:hypothetical protein